MPAQFVKGLHTALFRARAVTCDESRARFGEVEGRGSEGVTGGGRTIGAKAK